MTRDELEKDMGRYCIIDGKIAPNPDIERLAKIDSREVYPNEDEFTDSDSWLARREYEWVVGIVNTGTENKGGSRRKDK